MKLLLCMFLFTTTWFATAKVSINGNGKVVKIKIPQVHGDVKRIYKPEWSDLDKRPLPQWYDEAKVGIFLHWGVFSVPSFGSEWFWINLNGNKSSYVNFMEKNYRPGFTYQDFAPMFTAEFFEPEKWAELFLEAGAKYVVLTSKHHEGFTLFPSRKSFSWNAVEVGPKRDLVRALADAVKSQGLKFGLYHSLFEWFNPIYLQDKENLYSTRVYPDTKLWPDIKQIVNDYEPSIIWADGAGGAKDSYWNSTELLAWLYNESPVKDEVVVNDRWGVGIPCHHGDFYNCADRYNPGKLQNHKWENAFPIDSHSWGYRRNIILKDLLTINEILKQLISTVSCGGNVLINIGPTKEGTISPIFQERLLQLGDWLKVNGEAIYGTSPWSHQNDTLDSSVWYTCTKTKYNAVQPTAIPRSDDNVTSVYAIVLKWPLGNVLRIKNISTHLHSGQFNVELLGYNGTYLKWKISKEEIVDIMFPDMSAVLSQHAWSLKFTKKRYNQRFG